MTDMSIPPTLDPLVLPRDGDEGAPGDETGPAISPLRPGSDPAKLAVAGPLSVIGSFRTNVILGCSCVTWGPVASPGGLDEPADWMHYSNHENVIQCIIILRRQCCPRFSCCERL